MTDWDNMTGWKSIEWWKGLDYKAYSLYAVVFLAVLAVSGLVTFLVLGSRLAFEIPELAGRDLQEVQTIIQDLPITVSVVGEEYDKNVPKGHVLDQSIAPGASQKGKAHIELVLSKGVQVRLIPPLTAMTVDQAKRMLKEKGIELGKVIRVHTESSMPNMVVAQRPTPEEWTGETIKVVASAGPFDVSYYCPEFVGMTREDAVLLASAMGITPDIKGAEKGATITRQWPRGGAIMKKGGGVALRTGAN